MTHVDKKDQPLPGMPHKARSRSSRLGYDGEHAVQLYLNARGFPCERPRAGMVQDRGDLIGLPIVVSIKNVARMDLAGWVGALPRMCRAASVPLGVVWHKRRGRGSPADWYVTMTGETFVALMRSYGRHLPSGPAGYVDTPMPPGWGDL